MKYYSTQRPVGPGTFPDRPINRPIGILNYTERTFVPAIGRMAWGEIEYDSPLPPVDVDEYELVADPNEKRVYADYIPHLSSYRLYSPYDPAFTIAYVDSVEEIDFSQLKDYSGVHVTTAPNETKGEPQ